MIIMPSYVSQTIHYVSPLKLSLMLVSCQWMLHLSFMLDSLEDLTVWKLSFSVFYDSLVHLHFVLFHCLYIVQYTWCLLLCCLRLQYSIFLWFACFEVHILKRKFSIHLNVFHHFLSLFQTEPTRIVRVRILEGVSLAKKDIFGAR